MKKVLFFCLMAGLLYSNNGFCGAYALHDSFMGVFNYKGDNSSIMTAWGNPDLNSTFIQDSSKGPGSFRIKQGWACCGEGVSLEELHNAGDGKNCVKDGSGKWSCRDDMSVMVFVAREIYPNGGLFCLTQLHVASSTNKFWIEHQQPNWPGMNCMVLCEPGYDGYQCRQSISGNNNDNACDTTDIAASIEKVKQNVYSGNDALAWVHGRMGTADNQQFFKRQFIAGAYEHVIYLGATDFMQHGVVAQPVLVAAVGDHPYVTWLSSGPSVGGKTKVLCAQGFTKNDNCEINSKNCGSKVWCNGYSDSNFKSNIHERKMIGGCNVIVCKDKSKALASNFDCIDYNDTNVGRCDKMESGLYTKAVECGTGEIFDGETCECVKAKPISKEIMQYGSRGRNTDMVNEQCWTKESPEDFAICVGISKKTTTSN